MSGCKTLKYVSLLHSSLLTDIAIKSIAQSKRLQVIKLEGLSGFIMTGLIFSSLGMIAMSSL